MEQFLLKISLLTDIVRKKRKALSSILDICENQETVLSQPDSNTLISMFNDMNVEKQAFIQTVKQSDEFFQNVFNGIKDDFDEKSLRCVDEIKVLQGLIKAVIDLDVAIRVKEERNKALLPNSTNKVKITTPKANKNYILEQYAKNKRTD